jgi:predicted unusual protein kinase regulating ubiquinone biosynthesis (AarF/ABC1/UbiB family)
LDNILETVELILDKMCEKNLIHGDLHWGNIGFQDMYSQSRSVLANFSIISNNNSITHHVAPLLIDFGFSKRGSCKPDIELAQLIRTLFPVFSFVVELYNRN